MEKVVGTKAAVDLVRRTSPVKVAIGFMYRELDSAKNEHAVTIDRALFESVITTLELVVEDLESRVRVDDRKVVEAQPRLAANRNS